MGCKEASGKTGKLPDFQKDLAESGRARVIFNDKMKGMACGEI